MSDLNLGGTGVDGALDLGGSPSGTGISWADPVCTINTDVKSVFNFTTINVPSGKTLTFIGSSFVTLKATISITVNGTIHADGGFGTNGSDGSSKAGGVGVAGGGSGGAGHNGGGDDGVGTGRGYGGATHPTNPGGGSGAGFGGPGGKGSYGALPDGVAGGSEYDEADAGGSGAGGGAAQSGGSSGAGGGAGGGSIKILTDGNVTIGAVGIIRANGGSGGAQYGGGGGPYCSAGGGGSGGRICIETYANVINSGTISAEGGNSGPTYPVGANNWPGGGGGGGRITLKDVDGLIGGTITINGGAGNVAGSIGQLLKEVIMTQYRIPVEESFSWQRPVIALQNDPPVVLVKAQRYIVGVGTGDWETYDNAIAWYDGAAWKFDVPGEGWCTYREDASRFYKFGGATWGLMESGLGDMLKSTYDADDDGIVDKTAAVDDGAGNASTAAEVKDAVTKAHAHANKAVLDAIEEAFTSALKASYDAAVAAAHSHANKAILDAIEEAFTSALKGNYDLAYSRRGSYDPDLKAIIMNIS